MTRHYEELDAFDRDGFFVIVDKTWEDISPRDCFDDSVTDMDQMCADIESGRLDWFMLRVRLMVDGYEMAAEYLGGMLYEDPRQVFIDGVVDDLIAQAMPSAKREVYRMYKTFQDLSWMHDAEGVTA